jgi:hypothetical protein
MDKTAGARRRQLLAAVSVLGVSLGMAEAAQAAKEDATTTQSSHKGQASVKNQASIKLEAGQHSVKYGGQSSVKYGGQNSYKPVTSQKIQGSYKEQGSQKVQGSYKESTGQQ